MLRNKKGMTLVEVAVVLVLFSILMAATVPLIIAGGNFLAESGEQSTEQMIGDAIYDFTASRMRYATSLSVVRDGDAIDGEMLSIKDGHLTLGRGAAAVDVFGDEYYCGRTARISVTTDMEDASGHTLVLAVRIFREGEQEPAYERKASLKLVNMDLAGSLLAVNWREADVDSWPNPELVYEINTLTEGGTALNEVQIRAQLLSQQYVMLRSLYLSASDAQKQVYAERIENLFVGASIGSITPFDYCRALRTRGESEEWPLLSDSVLEPLETANASLCTALRAATLYVKYCPTVDASGIATDALYYACADAGTAQGDAAGAHAYLIFNSRNGCWYAYNVRSGGGYSSYSLYDVFTASRSCGDVLDIIEASGEWIKLS